MGIYTLYGRQILWGFDIIKRAKIALNAILYSDFILYFFRIKIKDPEHYLFFIINLFQVYVIKTKNKI